LPENEVPAVHCTVSLFYGCNLSANINRKRTMAVEKKVGSYILEKCYLFSPWIDFKN
jgi:hypothetical protein